MFCSLTSLVIPTPKHDEVLNETPRIHHAARWRGRLAARPNASFKQHCVNVPQAHIQKAAPSGVR
jgi:hypothetical protein